MKSTIAMVRAAYFAAATTCALAPGLSHGEIASQEGTPLGTVKGRLRLGLRKLSGLLEAEDNHAGSMREEQV